MRVLSPTPSAASGAARRICSGRQQHNTAHKIPHHRSATSCAPCTLHPDVCVCLACLNRWPPRPTRETHSFKSVFGADCATRRPSGSARRRTPAAGPAAGAAGARGARWTRSPRADPAARRIPSICNRTYLSTSCVVVYGIASQSHLLRDLLFPDTQYHMHRGSANRSGGGGDV